MSTRIAKLLKGLVASAFAVTMSASLAVAEYPEKTISFVVPFPAGGSTDIAARLLGEQLSERLGQTIVIENKPGASGLIGASAVARSDPDGYTFLVTSDGIHSAAATGDANFDLLTDLVPVSQIVGGTLILVGSKSAPFDTIEGFVETAKGSDDKVNVAINAALGSAHMVFENFRREAGIDYQPVYYAGESPSLAALVSGEAQVGIISGPAARTQIEDGQVVGLAVTTADRFGLAPEIPTVGETVVPGFGKGYSTVMFAPKGTPSEIVEKMASEIADIVNDPAMADKLLELGLAPIGSTPQAYAEIVPAEFARNQEIIKDLREKGLVDK
ncbi:tripartite tricarboxylate transporter substrate binding protein [Microbaculum marinum]|uniref:Tripartite tricarboxylate transporter substrate binding protein n=1 Tax=Microbaculum marinum TaxID=1764581 RepID=A0AAW9RRF4_9HYPH